MKLLKYSCLCLLAFIIVGCQNKTSNDPSDDGNSFQIADIPPFEMELISDTLPNKLKFIEGTFYNNTFHKVTYGEDFKLSYYNDSVWQELEYESPVLINSIAYYIEPNSWSNFKFTLVKGHDYKPGRYRLSNKLSLQLETYFYVLDSIESKDFIEKKNDVDGVVIKMNNDTLSVHADTIRFSVTNNFPIEVFPLEHEFLMYYDEKNNSWMDYYYESYDGELKRKLKKGESTEFSIVLDSNNKFRYHDRAAWNKKQRLLPGKYLIRKYVDIPIYCEFIFSSDSLILEKYNKHVEEKPLRSWNEYIGGEETLRAFIKQNMMYPIPEEDMKESVYVDARLDIDTLGQATNPEIINISDSSFIDESYRLLNLLNKWEPARNTRGLQPSKRRIFIEFDNKD